MSETAPERPAARAGGGNVFTHRIGPLPMWVWVALIGGVIVAWSIVTDTGPVTVPQGGGGGCPPGYVKDAKGQCVPRSHPPIKTFPPRPNSPPPHVPIFNATYLVRKGETLNEVAKKFHVTREELAHANGFGTGAGLRTGERLKVPNPAGYGSPNKAP